MRCSRLSLLAAWLLVAPSPALAASVRAQVLAGSGRPAIVFAAAPGEANAVTLSYSDPSRGLPIPSQGGTVTLSDSGAPVTAAAPCLAVDPHTASCPSPPAGPYVVVELGDADDRLDSVPGRGPNDPLPSINNQISLLADGGPGDDRLDASNAFEAWLTGGGGSDQLVGTGYDDILADGDRTGSVGPDVIDGGGGRDEADYASRDGWPSALLHRWNGDPAPVRASGDEVRCGPGDDVVAGRRSRDFVEPACEWVVARRWLPFDPAQPDRAGRFRQDVQLPAHPSATYTVRCSDPEDSDWPAWAALRCSGSVSLRQATAHGPLLARGRLATLKPDSGELTARLRLSPLGRRLVSRPRGVRVRLRVRGSHVPHAAWTIRLEK